MPFLSVYLPPGRLPALCLGLLCLFLLSVCLFFFFVSSYFLFYCLFSYVSSYFFFSVPTFCLFALSSISLLRLFFSSISLLTLFVCFFFPSLSPISFFSLSLNISFLSFPSICIFSHFFPLCEFTILSSSKTSYSGMCIHRLSVVPFLS